MTIQHDTKGQPFIEWDQGSGCFKRAWIQDRNGSPNDWAKTGKYLNVVRVESPGTGPAGNATDFPVYQTTLSDEQILEAFVIAVCGITGCPL